MIILFSLTDPEYFKYIKALIRSSKKYFSESKFCATLVNCNDKQINQLKKINNCDILIENKKFLNDHEKRCYCASRRAHLFIKLREKYPDDYLVWVDADSIFVKNAKLFSNHIISCDVSMRPKNLKIGTFASGVITSGPKSIDFFNEYNNKINSKLNLNKWLTDQKMLNLTYNEFKNKINFKPLPNIFCDVWYSNNGVLWVAKRRIRDNNAFQNEVNKWI